MNRTFLFFFIVLKGLLLPTGDSLYKFSKIFFSLKTNFIIGNSEGPDEISHIAILILVCTLV